MDNNISKALWIGIGILFFIGVVSLGLSIFNRGKAVANHQNEALGDLERNLAESEFDKYDNQSVTGAEVLSSIKKYRDKADLVSVSVTTNKGSNTYLNSASFSDEEVTLGSAKTGSDIEKEIAEARKESSDNYINPVAKFDAKIRRDKNDVIAGIVFTQEKNED